MGQQSRLETIHATYTFHLDNLGTPCCNGYQFFGCAAWRALRGCRLRLRGRGSWFLEGPYQQVPWTGRRIASVQSVVEQKWLVLRRPILFANVQTSRICWYHFSIYVFVGPSRMLEWWCPTHGRFLGLGMGWFTMSRNPRIPWCCVSARGNLGAEVVPFLAPCSAATESI